MSAYYPPQQYGSYAQYSTFSATPQYPTQYQTQSQAQSQSPNQPQTPYPLYQAQPLKPPSPPPELPAAPDIAEVNPDVASRTLQRVILSELKHAGFESTSPPVLLRLELETAAFIERLFQQAHDYANLANRARPIATDVMNACKEFTGMGTNELHKVQLASKKRKLEQLEPPPLELLTPPSRSPSPELLDSDDEETAAVVPHTLRSHPHYLPPLPPKHAYLRTPASPPKRAALPSLEKKLKTAGLVQESLKNLLLATEENTDNEDGEILGAVVNWEATTYPRKRWKLSS